MLMTASWARQPAVKTALLVAEVQWVQMVKVSSINFYCVHRLLTYYQATQATTQATTLLE